MEENREPGKEHRCRFCNKNFQSGRSLGGHMRSHLSVTGSSVSEKWKDSSDGGTGNGKSLSGGGFEGYALRENPKKTWRISDSPNVYGHGGGKASCRQCGKVFQSWRALFGHMRCHSEKSVQGDSWGGGGGEARKVVVDIQSDTEGMAPGKRRRSARRVAARTRYGASLSVSIANGSSSVSEIEQEQEDVAISLMMLSRDVGSGWGGYNSVAESSDNNSVGFEVRSSVIYKGFAKADLDFVLRREQEFTKQRSEYSFPADEYLSNDSRKCISDASDDWFDRDEQLDNTKLECGVSGGESGKEPLKSDNTDFSNELGANFCEQKRDLCRIRIKLGNYSKETGITMSKKARHGSYDSGLGKASYSKIKLETPESERGKGKPKRSRYYCNTCHKVFRSFQALGGHKAGLKKAKGCCAPKIESMENSFDNDLSPFLLTGDMVKTCKVEDLMKGGERGESSDVKVKENEKYKCHVCFKVFSSGQALGGHKRAHLVLKPNGRSDASGTIVLEHQMSDLLDLNVPAPVEEGNTGFNPWWLGSNKHEPPVGVVSS